MLERHITVDDVWWTLESGETIAVYADDCPIPSRLVLGWVLGRPIHVVADDQENGEVAVVISAYRPDPEKWDSEFRRRIR